MKLGSIRPRRGERVRQHRDRGPSPDHACQEKPGGPPTLLARNIPSWHTLGVAANLSAAITSLLSYATCRLPPLFWGGIPTPTWCPTPLRSSGAHTPSPSGSPTATN